MKKICLVVVGIILICFKGFAQQIDKLDSTEFKSKKLKVEEVNLVTSYYSQDGNNSAVTGGIGTEKLTDYSSSLEIKLNKYDKYQRKHSFTLGVGVDYYTSASSDKVDNIANSSASSNDMRIYPSVSWEMSNEKTGNSFGAFASSSKEFDYQSYGLGVDYTKKSSDENTELNIKLQTYQDNLKVILPIELRLNSNRYTKAYRATYNANFSYSKVVNERLQLSLLLDLAYQNGYLALPFHRVFLNNGGGITIEKLPNTRFKIPLGIRANYYAGDKVIIRSYYRFYTDNWGLNAHTASLETPIKITPFFSISPFYRYYNQTGVKYFRAYQKASPQDEFATSNFDLSKFTSNHYGTGLRWAPPKGVLGLKHIAALELRYGHYTKNYGMNANIISISINGK